MPRREFDPPKPSRACSLYIGSSFDSAWETVVWPWLERILSDAWKFPLPSLVIVPTRGQVNDLKARLISKGASHLGVQFVTPASLRVLLARENAEGHSQPEHLRLLLSVAAAEMEKRPNESESLAAQSVARAPAPLLRTLERLETAGWKFNDLPVVSFAPVVGRFRELCRQCHFLLPGQEDKQHLRRAKTGGKKFSNVLVTGFDGSHWPDWFLLRAAVALANNPTVVVEEPRGDFSEIDLCWIGSWEEISGEAKRVGVSGQALGDSLFSEEEMRGSPEDQTQFDFVIGTNVSEQAEAITWQCVRYLAEDKCARLGVIFPAKGALARLVSNSLGQLDIPHNDGLAHIVPGIFESAEWQSWMELQQTPRLDEFLHFLNALPEPRALWPEIRRQTFEDVLQESYSEVLLDDLEVFREFCLRHENKNFRLVGEALRAFPFLPVRGTLIEFLKQTQASLKFLDWKQHALEIASVSDDWAKLIDAPLSRTLFLRWLDEVANAFGVARSSSGDHPYAHVQLLTVAQAQGQHWSHLIFAGCNEGAWPPAAGMEFARAEEIRSFNRNVQQLNKRATQQGSQGEGHTSVRGDHSLYLGPAEQRAIALRQFEALLESTNGRVTLAASLLQEDAAERFWNPSECFAQLFLKVRRQALEQSTLKNLQHATALFVQEARKLAQKSKPNGVEVQQTLTAFEARRDTSTGAGEYDFALRSDASYRPSPTLSVSDFEQLVSSPALVWMKRYLGVEASVETASPWATSTGKWVHRWLANISGKEDGALFVAFPSSISIDERIRHAADERRAALQKLCDSLGKSVPDWWRSGWLNAQFLARCLGSKLAKAEEDWQWMATEVPIGRDGTVQVAENVALNLRGQIDLVLAQKNAPDFHGQSIWIVDYKTGSTKELKTTDLHDYLVKGTALQLGLYALTIRHLGATEVRASVLSLIVKNVAPQLSVTELAQHTDVFADLAKMQRSGVFGMKGEIRPSFRYGDPYPLATLVIDNDILEEKWARSHPALVLQKEEWETW